MNGYVEFGYKEFGFGFGGTVDIINGRAKRATRPGKRGMC